METAESRRAAQRYLHDARIGEAPEQDLNGRVEKGFDFLGYCLWPDRLTVAQATVERFLARVTRLYEQEQGRPLRSAPLGSYVRRWVRWTGAGVPPSRSGYLSV